MFNPFREHFWRHVWGPWSKPELMTVTISNPITNHYGSTTKCLCQKRVCRECGKVDYRTV